MTDPDHVPGDHLARRAQYTPDRLAMVDASEGDRWTYRELDARVDRLAAALVDEGVDPGDRVGVMLDVGVRAIQLLFAVTRSGGIGVPLDPRLSAEELGPRIDLADPSLIVCEGFSASAVSSVAGSVVVRELGSGWPRAETPVDPVGRAADADQYWVYTSGSTGQPKLVRLTVDNLRSSAVASAQRLGVQISDRWYSPLPPWHVGGFAPAIRSTLYGTGVVIPSGFDASSSVEHIRELSVTCLSLVPTMLTRLMDTPDGTSVLSKASIRFVLTGGAATAESLVRRCVAAEVPLAPTYGMTETASQVATATPAMAADDPGTVGPPLWPLEVTIVDDGDQPVGPGVSGEIVVDGPVVSPGYVGSTGEIRDREFGFRTGDLGYRRNGRLYITGRVDERILSGGETVDPLEVRETLTGHPMVAEAVVVGVPDPEWGERVAALIVPAGGNFSEATIREYCREQLAGYKIPRIINLTDTIPRTATGSIDRAAVRRRLDDTAE